MRFWVTGASGMLGREVVKLLAGRDVVATDRELDIANAGAVEAFAATTPFTHLINCAAYTQVDRCEEHEADAMRVNADGAANLAHAARERGALAITVSTDYVFDGTKSVPYEPEDTTNPQNAYGRTKDAGEKRFLAGHPTGYVVRTSWLFGNGHNFVRTMLQLFAERPEVRVVDDQTGRPTYAPDLAHALVELAMKKPEPGIYHFANASQTTWYGLASAARTEAIARGKKADATLVKIPTSEYPTPAKRPMYTVLSTTKIERAIGIRPRAWREALSEYMGGTP